MPLTPSEEPAVADTFGVRFTMEDRGTLVRCHVLSMALNVEDRPAAGNSELVERFERNRAMFERLASNLYDAGHRTPWIGGWMER